MPPPRIYLAGPDVFLPDAKAFALVKKKLCTEYGFEGVFPLDPEIKNAADLAPAELAATIARNNENLMRGCDLLIANCTPFRSVSMDPGTAYEVGFMRALGRPVLGYSNIAAPFAQRSKDYRSKGEPIPHDGDFPETEIEDFGLAENLMIDCAITASASKLFTGTVAPGHELTDLTAFEKCLSSARMIIGPMNSQEQPTP
ncbi:MAG: nucleoside 2-deoxyribosyltransferase [Alphaproteobacteria bacterium]|nr:nucleoside 2-deoxyribosyltransferase [Alphaproteobacteria bacterium]